MFLARLGFCVISRVVFLPPYDFSDPVYEPGLLSPINRFEVTFVELVPI